MVCLRKSVLVVANDMRDAVEVLSRMVELDPSSSFKVDRGDVV